VAGHFDAVVVGASAGGVEALTRMVRTLPEDFPAAVLIVMHVNSGSILPQVLGRVARMPVTHGGDGERIQPRRIYVAPPDRHLTVDDGLIRLTRGPRENGHRPAIDLLFRSAARAYRDRLIGVVLSGQLDDGSAGLLAIKARGGVAIVQDPDDATFPSMPRNASLYVDVDHALPADQIGPALVKLVRGEPMASRKRRAIASTRKKVKPPRRALSAARMGTSGDNGILVCPECQGPLHREQSGNLIQWTCRVGHSFSPESLTEAQTDALERVLWVAVRTLTERAQVQRQSTARLDGETRLRMAERAEATAEDVELIRSILERL
jgi:two-component system, chemotaxis family, protein-glutamate methylesterase/glutaminase